MTCLWKKNKTFEQLADEIGLATIFAGTDADQVIQEAFLEWLFDYRLCSDNDATFLRYFRRRFNNLYPRYLEQVRVLTTRANFDPFVTEYFQDLITKTGQEINNDSKTTTGQSTGNTTITKGTGSTTTRTPNLTEVVEGHETNNNSNNTINSGTDRLLKGGSDTVKYLGTESDNKTGYDELIKSGSEKNAKTGNDDLNKYGCEGENKTGYDELQKIGFEKNIKEGYDTATKSGERVTDKTGHDDYEKTGSETNAKTGNDSITKNGMQILEKQGSETTKNAEEGVATSDGKSDGFAIQYPEANLNALPVGGVGYDIGSQGQTVVGGWAAAQRDIAYANSESLSMSANMSKNRGSGSSTISYGEDETGSTDRRRDITTFDDYEDRTDYSSNNELSFTDRKDVTTYGSKTTESFDDYEDRTDYHSDVKLEYSQDRADRTNYSSGVTHNMNLHDKTTYNSKDTLSFENRSDRTNYSSGVTRGINKTDTTTYGSSDTTTYGHNVQFQENGSVDNSSTRNQTGSETTNVMNNGSDTNSSVGSNSSIENSTGQSNQNVSVKQEYKGRSESVADIIPRAIKAIINTNELMWFIDSMKVCFDCTDFY